MGWRRRVRARDLSVPLLAAAVAAASGCSTIGGEDAADCASPPCEAGGADGGGGGGAGDGGGDPDADGGVPLGAFSEPTLIDALVSPTTGEGDPSVTEDGLELYFSSDRPGGGGGGQDLWVTRRESVDDPWGEPDPVTELNSADADFDPEVSADGLTLWLNSTRVVTGTKGGFDLFVSTRDSRDDDWGEPEVVPALNSADHDMGAVMDASATVLVFHRLSGDVYALYQSSRDDAGEPWGTPQPLTGINTAPVADAYLSPDGLTLFFNSTREGGEGSWDIWMATRQSKTSLFFTLPANPREVNSGDHDANVGLAQGLRYLVMTSARSGNHEIYEAGR